MHSRHAVLGLYAAFILTTVALAAAPDEPLIRISDHDLGRKPVLVAYGDIRFTDPKETDATNPKVRRWLVNRIAEEKPAAVLLSGDVPWHGEVANDYDVYRSETAAWNSVRNRAGHIFISVTLGNHELNGKDPAKCIENWWTAFPKLRGLRWYSVAFGSRIRILNLDSNSSLLPVSVQIQWIESQLASLPQSVRFVIFNMHHPPLADAIEGDADHSARPNEAAFAAFLKASPARQKVRFVVNAGHVHNYERFLQDDTVYLVSGGGGAKPKAVQHGPADLFQNAPGINYHYMKFVLHGKTLNAEMVRVTDPAAATPSWEVRDRFQVKAWR